MCFAASSGAFLSLCSKLNNNNLTTLPHNVFAGLTRLRTLRLSENLLACDCHLSWLSRFLRGAPRLAPYTRCQSPSHLKGQNVANLHVQEFKCSGKCGTNGRSDDEYFMHLRVVEGLGNEVGEGGLSWEWVRIASKSAKGKEAANNSD